MADRFVVVHSSKTPDGIDTHGWDCWVLIDTKTNTTVGWDGGEPEDQLLVRDWGWVVAALNKLDQEN